jgi:hypothetical protein
LVYDRIFWGKSPTESGLDLRFASAGKALAVKHLDHTSLSSRINYGNLEKGDIAIRLETERDIVLSTAKVTHSSCLELLRANFGQTEQVMRVVFIGPRVKTHITHFTSGNSLEYNFFINSLRRGEVNPSLVLFPEMLLLFSKSSLDKANEGMKNRQDKEINWKDHISRRWPFATALRDVLSKINAVKRNIFNDKIDEFHRYFSPFSSACITRYINDFTLESQSTSAELLLLVIQIFQFNVDISRFLMSISLTRGYSFAAPLALSDIGVIASSLPASPEPNNTSSSSSNEDACGSLDFMETINSLKVPVYASPKAKAHMDRARSPLAAATAPAAVDSAPLENSSPSPYVLPVLQPLFWSLFKHSIKKTMTAKDIVLVDALQLEDKIGKRLFDWDGLPEQRQSHEDEDEDEDPYDGIYSFGISRHVDLIPTLIMKIFNSASMTISKDYVISNAISLYWLLRSSIPFAVMKEGPDMDDPIHSSSSSSSSSSPFFTVKHANHLKPLESVMFEALKEYSLFLVQDNEHFLQRIRRSQLPFLEALTGYAA